jgi:hypothetical protein
MAYTSAEGPLIDITWDPPRWRNVLQQVNNSSGVTALKVYLNRKTHSGGTYYYWPTDDSPDPNMDNTFPPFPKGEYSDHVVVQILEP